MNLLTFKSKSLIYITEDSESISKFEIGFKDLFSNIIYTKTYSNIIEKYFKNIKESIPIDLILFDLNSNSFPLLKEIRNKNNRIPIILISDDYTSFSSSQLVNLSIAHCFDKQATFDIQASIDSLTEEFLACIQSVEKRILTAYLDFAAIVTRVDLNHNFVYVNDMFEKISKYNKEEILGQSETILNEINTNDKSYENMTEKLKEGQNWNGLLKKISKDKEEYYTNTTVFPIFGSDKKIREYLSIQFLVTDDVEKISKLKKYIISEKSKSLQTNKDIDKLVENKLKDVSKDEKLKLKEFRTLIEDLQVELNKTKNEKRDKAIKYSKLEDVLRDLKNKEQDYFIQSKVTIRKLAEANRLASVEKTEIAKKTKSVYVKLENAQHNIETLQNYITDYKKRIRDLEDVIASNEEDLSYLKAK